LKFGTTSYYLGYSALSDFFPTMRLKPNDTCEDNFCRQRQQEFAARPVVEEKPAPKEEEAVVSENKWGEL